MFEIPDLNENGWLISRDHELLGLLDICLPSSTVQPPLYLRVGLCCPDMLPLVFCSMPFQYQIPLRSPTNRLASPILPPQASHYPGPILGLQSTPRQHFHLHLKPHTRKGGDIHIMMLRKIRQVLIQLLHLLLMRLNSLFLQALMQLPTMISK
jgi:hypothetical protein